MNTEPSPALYTGILLVYVGIVIWAARSHRKAITSQHRILFALIALATVVILAAEILKWSQPQYSSSLQYPITILEFLLGILIFVGFVIGDRAKRNARHPTGH